MEYQKLSSSIFEMVKNNNNNKLIKEKLKEDDDTLFRNFFRCKTKPDDRIKKKINLPNKLDHHNTLIHYAAINGNVKLLNYFIKKNVNLSIVNDNGETPLHLAIKNHQSEIIELLLDNKVDPNIRTNSKYTCLDYTIFYDDFDLFKIILSTILQDKGVTIIPNKSDDGYRAKRIDINFTTEYLSHWTYIDKKCYCSKFMDYPKECGIINYREFYKMTNNCFYHIDYGINQTINLAIKKKRYHFVEHFLYAISLLDENKINNKKIKLSKENTNLLIQNCFKDNQLDIFLKCNKYIKQIYLFENQNTILHELFTYQKQSSENFIEILGYFKNLINKINGKGETVLHLVARYKNKELYDLLLKYGADEKNINFLGETPKIILACQYQNYFIGL